MTFHKKLIKCETQGSRVTRDLKPTISGKYKLSYMVYEYIDNDKYCIMEIYGSDSPVLDTSVRWTKTKENAILNDPDVTEYLTPYPAKFPQICQMTVEKNKCTNINEVAKSAKFHNRAFTYLRKEKNQDQQDIFVYDEG